MAPSPGAARFSPELEPGEGPPRFAVGSQEQPGGSVLFNSVEFFVFFPLVFALYWFVFAGNRFAQNAFVVAASYVFYGWWDWRFLSLIVLSSSVDYAVGLALGNPRYEGFRKQLLWVSLGVNLGLLGFFKYWNFFIDSFADLVATVGLQPNLPSLYVVLPVGISFYTFQSLSYTIDVYRRKIEPTRDVVAFFAFVSFFPQLVAGPIERAANLLPQFLRPRTFDGARAGSAMRLVLWGLVKKVVVADTCALYVDRVFASQGGLPASELGLGLILFAFQIYGDFSGYSDIARGTARLLGFELMVNFATPYFARDFGEFWKRWHISLSTWFRDYVYISLGGNRVPRARHVFNVMVTFVVSGLWHGADWTFLVWGALHGLYYLPLVFVRGARSAVARSSGPLPRAGELAAMTVTFTLTSLAWVFFRAASIGDAVSYLDGMTAGGWTTGVPPDAVYPLILVVALALVDWLQRGRETGLAMPGWPRPLRLVVYAMTTTLVLHHFGGEREFIYFQF